MVYNFLKKERGLGMALLNLELENVRERVTHDFSYTILSNMGFSGKLIR